MEAAFDLTICVCRKEQPLRNFSTDGAQMNAPLIGLQTISGIKTQFQITY